MVAVFRSSNYAQVSFADWLSHSLVAATFNLDPETVARARCPRNNPAFMRE